MSTRERESVGIAASSVFANRSWADCCDCSRDCCDYRHPTGLIHILLPSSSILPHKNRYKLLITQFFSTQSTEYHPPSVVPQIDLMRQNIKYLFCQYFNSSFSCLECLRRCLTSAIPGTHWQLCPRLSPSLLTLMMFNTRVTTIKATIRGEPTIHSGDHNASRPPTEAGTTKSTYQSSNRTSAL